jgi:hypothetical protein
MKQLGVRPMKTIQSVTNSEDKRVQGPTAEFMRGVGELIAAGYEYRDGTANLSMVIKTATFKPKAADAEKSTPSSAQLLDNPDIVPTDAEETFSTIEITPVTPETPETPVGDPTPKEGDDSSEDVKDADKAPVDSDKVPEVVEPKAEVAPEAPVVKPKAKVTKPKPKPKTKGK